jgi:2-(1,2-epoxy-1,2-dihydrophenyl)acetyl-CoA isomerase
MERDPKFDLECDCFSSKKIEDIILLGFKSKENLLLRATDLNFRDEVMDYLNRVSRSDSIKAVIIRSSDKEGGQEYFDFYDHAFKQKWDRFPIHRIHNVFAQLIMKIINLDKIVIHANSGRVISLFLNVSLACDYRIIADNTVYQNPYLKLGLVPIGGGAFFLPRMIGSSKAYDILLSDNDISAREALKLGIVDKVVAADKVEAAALDAARRFAQKPPRSLAGVKRLINYSMKDLQDYMEFEHQELIRIVKSKNYQA